MFVRMFVHLEFFYRSTVSKCLLDVCRDKGHISMWEGRPAIVRHPPSTITLFGYASLWQLPFSHLASEHMELLESGPSLTAGPITGVLQVNRKMVGPGSASLREPAWTWRETLTLWLSEIFEWSPHWVKPLKWLQTPTLMWAHGLHACFLQSEPWPDIFMLVSGWKEIKKSNWIPPGSRAHSHEAWQSRLNGPADWEWRCGFLLATPSVEKPATNWLLTPLAIRARLPSQSWLSVQILVAVCGLPW